MIGDVRVYENGSGGDMFLLGNDIQVLNGFENVPYIAMFGGNINGDTIGPKPLNVRAVDYWGNYLRNPDAPENWYNSKTERLLRDRHLSTSTRIEIEQAVNADLDFMRAFAQVDVSVELIQVDKVRISIKIQELSSLESNEFIYLWDATEQELNLESFPSVGQGIGLNYVLNFGL